MSLILQLSSLLDFFVLNSAKFSTFVQCLASMHQMSIFSINFKSLLVERYCSVIKKSGSIHYQTYTS